MLKVGNDNVAIGLRDVEYTYEGSTVMFPLEKGIYFFSLSKEILPLMIARTIVFDSAIAEKANTGIAILILSENSSKDTAALSKMDNETCVISLAGSFALTNQNDIASFKYIPKE